MIERKVFFRFKFRPMLSAERLSKGTCLRTVAVRGLAINAQSELRIDGITTRRKKSSERDHEFDMNSFSLKFTCQVWRSWPEALRSFGVRGIWNCSGVCPNLKWESDKVKNMVCVKEYRLRQVEINKITLNYYQRPEGLCFSFFYVVFPCFRHVF